MGERAILLHVTDECGLGVGAGAHLAKMAKEILRTDMSAIWFYAIPTMELL